MAWHNDPDCTDEYFPSKGPTVITGPMGPVGPVGPAGPIGPIGPMGPKGQVNVADHFNGGVDLALSADKGKELKLAVDAIVLTCGPKLPGDYSDSERIQRTIDKSTNLGDVILLPKGAIVHRTITLKPNRVYRGSGWGQPTLKAMDGANIGAVLNLPHSSSNFSTVIEDIMVDCNKSKNGASNGIFIGSMVHSFIRNVYVVYAKATGIYIDGVPGFKTNTSNIVNCRAYNCNGYGLYLSQNCEDVHVLQGDYGFNLASGLLVESPSSSIRDITCWGNQNHGIEISPNAVCLQLWNNQIEGNANTGIYLGASFAHICGNKIYDNANIPANYGKIDAIYVNATPSNPIEGVSIIGNKVYSGLYAQTGYHRYALAVDVNHKNFNITGNDFLYQGNGSVDVTRRLVSGLNETDRCDFSWINTFVKLNMSQVQAIEGTVKTKVNFDKVLQDFDNNFVNGRLVAREYGRYQLHCNLHVNGATPDSFMYLEYRINGELRSRISAEYGGGYSNMVTLSGSDSFTMMAGDSLEIHIFSNISCTLGADYYLSSLTFRKL